MKVEEIITRKYIANDGTIFKDEASCKKYEDDKIIEVLESYSEGGLEDLVPINYCSEDYGTELDSYYYWFEVNDRGRLYEIAEAFGLQVEAMKIGTPTFICVRKDCELDKYELYSLEKIKNKVKGYFKLFNLDIEFNEVKEK